MHIIIRTRVTIVCIDVLVSSCKRFQLLCCNALLLYSFICDAL